ncbi:DUF4176 domain-containing protein [Staphylococcus pettenkoferi]|uniref:DUF4176 domain-containing protein n=2 Tax=Staphylococcus pettenkoferi TaxID=170573 RepID=UPI000B51D1F4|nr:DUF4176 domain-containing protein [Staphylococcus pettenkoferi]ASE36980.1 DUF4176 domain-containing protein [Staphylococcus pettenkoferi]MCY1581486.1 DUF4176 domain-containing protein [Staphylococcus pettenkoferi]MCY1621288.1 DUF4176 domain-containing protein [Staphylococcus pettenkoferi]
MEKIGSIIYLKEGSQKLMFINRGPIVEMDNQRYIFDYSACKYPIGVFEDEIYYFNEENIDKVIFEGYSDEDETRFQDLYEDMLKKLDSDIKRGNVKQERGLI